MDSAREGGPSSPAMDERENEAASLAELEASLRRREAALLEQEAELKEAYRTARLGTWRWEQATDTTVWTEEVYRTFGFDPKLPPPGYEEIRAVHAPASAERLRKAVERALSEGEPYAMDMEIVTPAGERKWLVARGEQDIRGGKVVGLRGTIQDITERKRAEQELAATSEMLRRVLDSMTDGLVVMDMEWRYTYANELGASILGFKPKAMVGSTLLELFPDAETTKFPGMFRRAIKTRKPVHFLEYYPEPLNRWMECHCYPTDEGLSIYFRDMSELKETEAAWRETESRFQKLYEAKLLGICYPDRFGRFSEGNDEFLRIVGYTREDLEQGRVRWDTMTPAKYAVLDAQHIAEAAEKGSCAPYEKEYVRKDGTLVPILCGYALLDGSEDEYIGFVMDLSAQKAAEQAVRDREKRFRGLAESLPQLVWEGDHEGRRIFNNQRLLDYAGMTPEELAGWGWHALVHPEELERTKELWRRSVTTGEPYVNEYRLRRHDGVYRLFLARAVPLRNEAGEIERWLGSATDIHEQKLAEEAVRRTEKLAATGRLAASMAHEINNPLAAVTNSLYLALLDGGLSEETRGYLAQAERELGRVAAVTTQTLRFHRQSTLPAMADLGELMDSAIALFAGRAQAAGTEVRREYGKEVRLWCCGDELRQVFANLVSNAVDAMGNVPGGTGNVPGATVERGRVWVRIRAAKAWGRSASVGDGSAGPWVSGLRVSVGDNGSGIEKDLLTRIFEPFLSTKEATGTGLGLWVSKGIVVKHRGTIAVKSKVGVGTVFSVFLPGGGSRW